MEQNSFKDGNVLNKISNFKENVKFLKTLYFKLVSAFFGFSLKVKSI